MARLSRLYAPGTVQLVQARLARPLAHAHSATPSAALNQIQQWLAADSRLHAVALHGWVLLPDRIVLLATPEHPQSLPRLIQGLGRHMAAGMVHGRVFEGRYHNALVDSSWVSACLVWLELLPMAAGLVDTPARWPWSSATEHLGQLSSAILQDHPAYWNLGNTPFARQARHRELLQAGLKPPQTARIEQALHGQWALGDPDFLARLAHRGSRRASPAPRGRPRKNTDNNDVTN